jgi:G:T-mismatch repair DNA endonuclease (very short patch repair protein)
MLKKDKIIQDKYNGVHPTCQCGCGQQTRYEAKLKDYCKWISGHQSRVAGHFGDPKSEKRVNAIISTRKAKFASGEYNHILDKVSQNRSEEIKQKISKGGTGVSRPKADGFGIGRIHSQTTKDKMSDSAIQRILKTGKVKRSRLEYKFEGILELLEIEYIHSYFIKDINKIYDFYLPKYNIIIEIDGDFWHCNPNTKYALPECKTQHINIENDKFKSQWALDNGYTLLRFWENDINNNIKQIKQTLLEHCK